MRRAIGWLVLAMCLGVGCLSAGGGPADDRGGPGGGKADSGGDDGPVLACQVVEVIDTNVLEEGLGGIFDYDQDGYPNVDGDSKSVHIRSSDLSELGSGLIASIGQYSFGLHDAGDVLVHERPSTVGDQRVDTWRMRFADAQDEFTIRVFSTSRLGVVLHAEPGEAPAHLATIDCRGYEAPDFDSVDGPMTQLAAPDCSVVAVHDSNVLEEGLGSVFDLDEEGYFGADEDSTSVSVGPSSFSELPSGLVASIGQYSFGLHDAGDSIERIQEEPGNEDLTAQSYRLKMADSDDSFIVRIFLPLRVGVVLHESPDADGPAPLANIDCRGLPAPIRD